MTTPPCGCPGFYKCAGKPYTEREMRAMDVFQRAFGENLEYFHPNTWHITEETDQFIYQYKCVGQRSHYFRRLEK